LQEGAHAFGYLFSGRGNNNNSGTQEAFENDKSIDASIDASIDESIDNSLKKGEFKCLYAR
jgi:hypothetical protein